MKYFILLALLIFISSCKEADSNQASENTLSCRGEYAVKDSSGLVRQRFNEYGNSLGCLTDPVPLTQWEVTLNKRFDAKVQCIPQTDLPSMWIKTNGNYYSYRDSKIFIELNAAKGEAKRLIIGEMQDGSKSFQRQVFCYYLRTDVETEPTNPYNYGSMILFDLELSASSNIFSPMEIYSYDIAGNSLLLTKMDDNQGLDWTWCPSDSVPWGFCDFLRNGNEMYYPEDPAASVQAQLKAEAILIRSEFNSTKISKAEFDSLWNSTITDSTELGTTKYINAGGKWKYTVSTYFDEPLYVGREWRKYLRRERPSMPDVAWASTMQFPHICYSATKEFIYPDGSKGKIFGEACYDQNGNYSFTQ